VKSRLTPTSLSTGEKVCNVVNPVIGVSYYISCLKCVHSYRVDKVAMVTDCVVAMVTDCVVAMVIAQIVAMVTQIVRYIL